MENINVMSVVIYTILKRARAVGRITSLLTPPLINSLTVGSAPYAALPKICLKKQLSPHKAAGFFVPEDWFNETEKSVWVGLPPTPPFLSHYAHFNPYSSSSKGISD
jgi:hypothetical protein